MVFYVFFVLIFVVFFGWGVLRNFECFYRAGGHKNIQIEINDDYYRVDLPEHLFLEIMVVIRVIVYRLAESGFGG